VAAGDAHRVWFPEMVEYLRLRWRDDLSMEALLGLRDELDDMLGRIRSTRHISNPVFKCLERRRDLICMATPRRQSPLDSQGARTPMNGEPSTHLIRRLPGGLPLSFGVILTVNMARAFCTSADVRAWRQGSRVKCGQPA
jgi:hypothetical protein